MTGRALPPKKATWFEVKQTHDHLTLHFGGPWLSRTVGAQEPKLQPYTTLEFPQNLPVQIIVEKDCVLDMSGACLLGRFIKTLQVQKRAVDIQRLIPTPLLDYFLDFQPSKELFTPRSRWYIRWLDAIGYEAYMLSKTTLNLLAFLGEVLITWLRTLQTTLNLRWVSIFRQADEIGVKAIPIIGLISFLIGVVLSYQSINQLSRFGAEIYTVDFLGISLLREISVLLTAIVIAGRSGSAFTAQIGTMALNQEIDAIRMLGLNPILVLVVPRLVAILISLPLLVFFAMIMGLIGGMLMTTLTIDMTPLQFTNQLQRAISVKHFWVGMSKAPLFALLIGLVGCFRGFQVKGSAESVGRMTTQSVVESIFLVIVFDAFMSIFFSYLKI